MTLPKEKKLNEILQEFGLEKHADQIKLYSPDQFDDLARFLSMNGYSMNLVGKITRSNEELDRGIAKSYEEWLILDLFGQSPAVKLIVQDEKMTPQCIFLSRMESFIIISDEDNLLHEIYHVKEYFENPDLEKCKEILKNELLLPDSERELAAEVIFEIIHDYFIDVSLKMQEKAEYKKRYLKKLKKLVHFREIPAFQKIFEVFVLSEGNLPENLARIIKNEKYFSTIFQNSDLKSILQDLKHQNLSVDLTKKLVRAINAILQD
ncbi:MAG: hypothetical protein ACXQS8_08595 [Candidatus Helarchaeales archaeon]